MATSTNLKTARRGLFVTIVFALVAAIALFAFLWFVTGGFLIAVLAAVILIAIVGSFHYLLWGRTMAAHAPVVYSRPRVESTGTEPPDHFNLPLDERERAELLRLIDRSLAEPSSPAQDLREVLQGVRARLERYGA
jgi:hypothetical protein